MRNPWTGEQVALLRQIYSSSLHLSEIGDLVRHPAGSVKAKAESLGLVRKPSVWTPEQEALLETLYGANLSLGDISRKVGHQIKDVEHKAFQMGLRRVSSTRTIRTGIISHPRPGVLVHKSGI